MRLLLFLLCSCATAAAQLVSVDGGQGMTGEPSGGTVGVDYGKWTVNGSLGLYNDSVVGGANLKLQLNPKWNLWAGDQSIGIGIPTDAAFSSGMLARGATLGYSPDRATQIAVFGGMAGGGNSSTEVLFFTPQIALGALSIDHYVDEERHFLLFGRALFSNRQTILGGGLYRSKRLQAGFAGGIGSNQPHAQGLLNYMDKQWSINSGYLYSGSRFELLTLPQFRYAQEDRGNIDLRWNHWKNVRLSLGHHQYLQPPLAGAIDGHATRGTTDQVGGTISLFRVQVGSTLFQSQFSGIYASAASYLASIRLTGRMQFGGNYYRPLHSSDPMSILTLTTQQKVNRRLKLAQFATHANGQWNVNYGGSLLWDSFDINTGYSTYFAPLAPGGGRFTQQMNLSGHVHLGRWQFGVQTYVQPDGRLVYSYEVKSFYFHPTAGGSVQAPQSRGAGVPKFVIMGRVTLETTGKGIAFVPLRIGDEIVYTDEAGTFSLRVTRRRAYKIQLLLERQVGFHYYEQVNGPGEAMSGTDDTPGQAQFVLRVNEKRVLKIPTGGIVIGQVIAAPVDTSPTAQLSGPEAH